jgi:hypothetical protein
MSKNSTFKPRKPRRETLADFFATSPLRNSGLVIDRNKCAPSSPGLTATDEDEAIVRSPQNSTAKRRRAGKGA